MVPSDARDRSRSPVASKMELFAAKIKREKVLQIFAKSAILDVTRCLNRPLNEVK